MFEIGFSELLLVGIVALLVLGPQRLPHAARTAGRWIGHIKRTVSNIKAQVESEVGAQQLREQLENPQLLQLEQELRRGIVAQPLPDPVELPSETPKSGPALS
jgi:sec-independent protein translocase protein TatB